MCAQHVFAAGEAAYCGSTAPLTAPGESNQCDARDITHTSKNGRAAVLEAFWLQRCRLACKCAAWQALWHIGLCGTLRPPIFVSVVLPWEG